MNIRTSLVLPFVTLFAVSAHAQMPVPATQLTARHSGKCATPESTRQGAQVIQRACNGSPDQQWRMQPAGNGQFTFVNAATNTCLDVEGAATGEGAHVVHFPCKATSNLNQLWMVRSTPQGQQLMAVHSQRCLNVSGADSADGARFVQGECASKPHELFDTGTQANAGSGSGYASSSGGESIVGEWKWFNGNTITMRPDGSVQGSNNQHGKWVSEAGGRFVVTWQEGWIDRLMLSDGNRRLSGSNQNGTQISAERIGNAPATASSGPVLRESAVANIAHSGPGHRDCGTGADDAGCNMMRNNQLPMDGAELTGVMTALRATPQEAKRVNIVRNVVGAKLMTAQQLGLIIDLFQDEMHGLEAARSLASTVVDPQNLSVNAGKFHSVPNKMSYSKIIASVQTNNTSNDRMGERNNSAPNRLDMRHR